MSRVDDVYSFLVQFFFVFFFAVFVDIINFFMKSVKMASDRKRIKIYGNGKSLEASVLMYDIYTRYMCIYRLDICISVALKELLKLSSA